MKKYLMVMTLAMVAPHVSAAEFHVLNQTGEAIALGFQVPQSVVKKNYATTGYDAPSPSQGPWIAGRAAEGEFLPPTQYKLENNATLVIRVPDAKVKQTVPWGYIEYDFGKLTAMVTTDIKLGDVTFDTAFKAYADAPSATSKRSAAGSKSLPVFQAGTVEMPIPTSGCVRYRLVIDDNQKVGAYEMPQKCIAGVLEHGNHEIIATEVKGEQ